MILENFGHYPKSWGHDVINPFFKGHGDSRNKDVEKRGVSRNPSEFQMFLHVSGSNWPDKKPLVSTWLILVVSCQN